MKKLNLNQRKVIVDLLVNLISAWLSISLISQVFIERKIEFYYLFFASITILMSIGMLLFSLRLMKK